MDSLPIFHTKFLHDYKNNYRQAGVKTDFLFGKPEIQCLGWTDVVLFYIMKL